MWTARERSGAELFHRTPITVDHCAHRLHTIVSRFILTAPAIHHYDLDEPTNSYG